MKTLNILFTLMFIASIIAAQDKVITKTFDVGKGVRLSVSVNPGDVKIKTWDKNQILVSVKGVDKVEHESIDMYERSNTLYVKFNSSYGWSGDYDFDFIVPANCHVDIRTTGGDIAIENDLVGEAALNTSGGDIEVKNVQGRLNVNTSGGDITVGEVDGNVSLSTSGGDINIKQITGKSANVNTMGGDIEILEVDSDLQVKTYGGDIKIGDVGGKASATTFGGDIELGRVAGSAQMETYGGNLKLKSASGKVEADTKGGDITLRDVEGSLNAKTAGGDIYVELDPSGSGETNLKSSSGKVTLILPASAKANVDASIRIRGGWGRHKDEYSISSDFMSTLPKVDEDRKEINAVFSINGGGEKIKISTVNSNIIIKKK